MVINQKNEVRFTLRLVPELDARLTQESARLGISKNNLIINILWGYVNSLNK